ncbi:MAG: hypothetical protein J5647_01895 [Spirochaetaceae bacterium]|nr:hypothetical protein [Spirochaetaceae bacterium]
MFRFSKLTFLMILVISASAFFACTPQTEMRSFTAEIPEDTHTLKKETDYRRITLSWTAPLRDVPQEEETTDNKVEKKIVDDIAAIKFGVSSNETEPEGDDSESGEPRFSEKLMILAGAKEKNVYPMMPGLGAMDVSQMSSAIYAKLTEFLTGLKNKSIKNDSPLFAEKYIGVVFLYELGFYPDITSWYIGTPFISNYTSANEENTYEIPVLLITKNGKFMCWISIDASKAFQSSFLIKQIVLGDLS